ncbi:MAG TPA: discoidin domain-containing protein [Polyangiaceae bacterium]|jgi:hypothetical protein|nr:discoidin domain-containing protein [Polyangiaceae bacterium]
MPKVLRAVIALLGVCLLLVGVRAWAAEPQESEPVGNGDLLFNKAPIHTDVHRRVGALTDGRKGREGDHWKSLATVPFAGRDTFVEYDLGSTQTIHGAWLQGDNNDTYELQISSDGNDWKTLWLAGPDRQPGLRTRFTSDLNGEGRYVRLHPRSGDGFFGITELQVFSTVPAVFPPSVPELRSGTLDAHFRDAAVLFGLAMFAPLLLVRGSRPSFIVLAVGLAAAGAVNLARAYFDALPIDPREVSLARGVVGMLAALTVARELFSPRRFPALRPVIFGNLAVTGVLGVVCFYNLAQPQFYSRGNDEWTFSHYLDLRQYYTTAKYFRELGYRGIYEADVATYLEDHPERESAIQNIPMRDLHSLKMSTPAKQQARIDVIKKNFTPERWDALKADERWFREAMGNSHWLEMLCDFGGNATPVWIAITHFLFSVLEPSNFNFTMLGLLDLALLGGMFYAVWRCYGWRTALIVMTVFGANDFIMYGTNWGGATLRHDWLAYLGFGACALRRERWMLGGAMLGLSTMIRVFPALSIVGAALPAFLRVSEEYAQTKTLPPLRALLERERATVRTLLGAAAAILVTFLLSSAILSPASWPDCLHKISQLSADNHPASIALRSLIGGWEDTQASTIRNRLPLFIAASALYVGLVGLAAHRRRIDQAALLGMVLVPVLLYPANYYIHFVFLLPMLATERTPTEDDPKPAERWDAGVWLVLLFMCAGQYFTTMVSDLGLHFYFETTVLFTSLTLLLGVLGWDDIVRFAKAEPPKLGSSAG